MPFTPLHMGPGIAVKAVLQRRFSLMVFGWAQVVTDLQPLVVMVSDRGELHGFSHTFAGATLIGLFCALSGKYLGAWGLRVLREEGHLPITWAAAFAGAYIGTYSHVLIDSIMHVDVAPFFPLSSRSPLHGIIGIDTLHIVCVAAAVVGGLAWWLVQRRQKQPDSIP